MSEDKNRRILNEQVSIGNIQKAVSDLKTSKNSVSTGNIEKAVKSTQPAKPTTSSDGKKK